MNTVINVWFHKGRIFLNSCVFFRKGPLPQAVLIAEIVALNEIIVIGQRFGNTAIGEDG